MSPYYVCAKVVLEFKTAMINEFRRTKIQKLSFALASEDEGLALE
jgi:hypothetical protein